MQTDVAASLRKKIFVGGLSKALNEEMLQEYFSKFGEVDKVTIMRQRMSLINYSVTYIYLCLHLFTSYL